MICMSGIRAPVVALYLTGAFEHSGFYFLSSLFTQNMPVTGKGNVSAGEGPADFACVHKAESSWLSFEQSVKL